MDIGQNKSFTRMDSSTESKGRPIRKKALQDDLAASVALKNEATDGPVF